MKRMWLLMCAISLCCITLQAKNDKQPVDYVNTLMGTDSKISLSNGNTTPTVSVPWGMNFWMAQTGKMGDGWSYTYASDKIRGFKPTALVRGSTITDSSPSCL